MEVTGASNLKILYVMVFLITICFFSFPAHAKYGGGTGEPNDPYLIHTAEQMDAIGAEPNDWDKHFKLMADIDLDPNLPGRKVFDKAVIAPDTDMDTSEYMGTPFTGVFDGNNHTISNMTIAGDRYLGLFGKLDPGAIISNLGLESVDVKGIDSDVSELVGLNKVITSISYGTQRGGTVGGLAGFNSGTITTSYSTGMVSGSGVVGGLVGFNNGIITTSYSDATVSGGGSVGGLVAWNHGTITTSYYTGTVTGFSWVGGLVGHNWDSIANCYSTGIVTGVRNVTGERIGGLVGENTTSNFFPFVSSITSSFWDMEASGQTTSAGGTGLTTTEMQDINTYLDAGWDFVDETSNGTCDYWQISPDDYPRLCYHEGISPVMPEGLGTTEQPYLIRDARDLGTVWFEPLAHYCLEASVNLSGITWSIAVVPWFDGTFDGNGYVISNLHIQGGEYLGLFGQLGSEAEISNLSMEAINVNGTGDYVGGLIGYNDGSITSSYSSSAITGYGHVGGLVGYNGSLITNCYSAGAVSGDRWVGGLVSYNVGYITNCYSIGAVNGPWGGLMGGGEADSVTASFWDTQTSNTIYSGGGIGKTTAQMQTASTFINAGWDFVDETANGTEDIWWILEGQDYPRLWWEVIE
jgi:hypothetical protein